MSIGSLQIAHKFRGNDQQDDTGNYQSRNAISHIVSGHTGNRQHTDIT